MQHYKYPSIEAFRHVVQYVRKYCPENTAFTFTGTTKLHGTNVSVAYDKINNEMWVQGRNAILTIEKDNYGFAAYVENNKNKFANLFTILEEIDSNTSTFVVYGEWCGPGIQKGVALNNLSERTFIIFDIYSSETGFLLDQEVSSIARKAHFLSVYDFGTWTKEIDFSNLEETQEYLTKVTEEVDKQCSAGTFFGITGPGEGIVWRTSFMRLTFKTKGDTHKEVSTKKLVEIDVEKSATIEEFVNSVCTLERMQKFYTQSISDFIRAVSSDVYKEEVDRLPENVSWKEVSRVLCRKIVEFAKNCT